MDKTIFYSDILLSYDTDIEFHNGDIMISSGHDHIKRKVHKLLITEKGDWKAYKNIGASPVRFIGDNNTRDTGNRVKDYLESNINPIIYPAVSDVKIIPINYDSIKVYIDIYTTAGVISTQPFTLDFINGISYSQFDDIVDKIVYSNILKQNNNNNINTPNPYLDRLRFR